MSDKLLVRIDASTSKELPCHYKFNLVNMQGLTPKVPKCSLEYGQAFHRGVAAWLNTGDPVAAKVIANTYYCTSACEIPERDVRTPGHLLTALDGYFRAYRFDTFKPLRNGDGKLAIELSFSLPFLAFPHVDFVVCGVMDAVGMNSGTLCFKDIKTTAGKKSPVVYFQDYEASPQMMLYAWALKQHGLADYYLPCIIDGVFLRAGDGTLYQRSEMFDYRSDLIEEHIEWLREECTRLAEAIERNTYRRNFSFCTANFSCEFKTICTAQEAYRKHIIDQQYKTREYNPATFGE